MLIEYPLARQLAYLARTFPNLAFVNSAGELKWNPGCIVTSSSKTRGSATVRLLGRYGTGVGLLLATAGFSAAQTIVQSFDGDRGPGLAACETGFGHCDRPEMNMAVNGKQVVQVTWQYVRVYDYTGRLLQSTPLPDFVRKAGLDPTPGPTPREQNPSRPRRPYEPSIVYDEFLGRWIVTVTALNDSTIVSTSSDARGPWAGTFVSCQENGPCLDYDPAIHIGYDKNGVYECGAHLGDDNPHTIPKVAYDCFALSSAEVLAIARRIPPAHIHRIHHMPLDIFPAIDHNAAKAPDAPAFFLSKTCDRIVMGGCQNAIHDSFQWIVDTFTWNGPEGTWNAAGQEQVIKTGIGSKENKWLYSKPCCGPLGTIPQAGNDKIALRVAESHRLTNLAQYGTHLQAAMTSGPCTRDCGEQGADAGNLAFWVDLDCSKPAACVVSQTAKITGEGINPEFASVGVDQAGDVGVVAVSSNAGTNLSILLWTRRNSDPPNTFHGPATLVAGTQPFTCLNTRDMATIGNAAGVLTQMDPTDGTKLWTTQQWGGDAERCVWTTRIVAYQVDSGAAKEAKPKRVK